MKDNDGNNYLLSIYNRINNEYEVLIYNILLL